MKVAEILNRICNFMKNQVYIFPKTNKSSKNIKYDNQASEILKDIVKPHYDDDGILVVGLLDFLMQTEWNA
ncbi:hypothetical protein [Fibrobacter sp. UBA2449]|uniref:hypothetical protein n=1 Tax=Fibrobacter sp. UBA2449 TaxID=1946529 RepID=UPI0025B9242E|nr:hypothetical protein [Fibrobacter sp. UBA2449]